MPRYFFHTADGSRDLDREGIDCADDGAARKQAIRYAGEVMRDEPQVLWDDHDFRVEVMNEAEDLLFTVVMISIDAPASGRPPSSD